MNAIQVNTTVEVRKAASFPLHQKLIKTKVSAPVFHSTELTTYDHHQQSTGKDSTVPPEANDLCGVMYESSNHLPSVTTVSVPTDSHHAPMDYEQEVQDYLSRRTPSPAPYTAHKTAQDSAMSPVATSSSSNSSPLSDLQVYHQLGHQPETKQMAAIPIPTPVSSACFSQPSSASIVPQVTSSASWSGSMDGASSNAKGSASTLSYAPSQGDGAMSPYPSPTTTYPTPSHATGSPTCASSSTSGTTKQKTVVAAKKRYSKTGSRATSGGSATSADRPRGESVTARRQKRLERNRESARLSRRRRKQYLEVLEERVTQLSIEMDQGRREHSKNAVSTIMKKRRELLLGNPTEQSLHLLDRSLHRISQELLVNSAFNIQQLKSFSLPPHTKFVLWLTLQGDTYFRGGRAASERLSAARIGERMLQSGNDKVPPAHSMWPLFCNEVGLSYDQEERVRNYQRTLLQTTTSWLDRHAGRSSGLLMQSFNDSFQAVGIRIRQKERDMLKGLTPAQKLKYHVWAEKNAGRIKARMEKFKKDNPKPKTTEKFEMSESYHSAANLYILNHKLQQVLKSLPRPVSFISGAALKRLSRRPSFESLGQQKEEGRALSREASFASTGSLKRSASTLSMEDQDKPHPQQVSPEDGEEAARPTVEKELGFIKEIIPPISLPVPVTPNFAQPQPTHAPPPAQIGAPVTSYPNFANPVTSQPLLHSSQQVSTHHGTQIVHQTGSAFSPPGTVAVPHQQVQVQQHHVTAQPCTYPPRQVTSAPGSHVQVIQSHHPQQYYQPISQTDLHQVHPGGQMAQQQNQPAQAQQQPPVQPQQQIQQPRTHARSSSFLPPHLNVVPEEMFPAGDGTAEDFFMSLMDGEDWAIGEGIDMDTNA